MSEEAYGAYKRVQVKVLYSFNNNLSVFLSRSRSQHSIKIVQIPLGENLVEEEYITLGAFDLKACIQQILRSSPENFRLDEEDYAVYYKDVTEQPEEPFVSQGVLSTLLNQGKNQLIPGRICQNLSASFLFGENSNVSSFTLEVRLKFHTIERANDRQSKMESTRPPQPYSKRRSDVPGQAQKRLRASGANMNDAIKATRTKSLPIFYHPPNLQIFNIINADKTNTPSRYDSKSVQERFKLAPFMQAKIIDNPKQMRRSKASRSSSNEPQYAMRTRSMVVNKFPLVSSPIQEESASDATDDTEYHDNQDEGGEDTDNQSMTQDGISPYPSEEKLYKVNSATQFQALPDLEDLDSRKTHAIPETKLPKNHGLVCTNSNCATNSSRTWRYFETGVHPNYLAIHRATEFNKKHYEGMFGPLCNACYLFLRNKGFMRPEGVVKKYLQQQKYKKDLKQKEDEEKTIVNENLRELNSNNIQTLRVSSPHKFLTPSHTPSTINQIIQNNLNAQILANSNTGDNSAKTSPQYDEINDFMNQLNAMGGPLTDIDPIPQDQNQGRTPPMIATKSNTRVINLCEDDEDKENCPPTMDGSSPMKNNLNSMPALPSKANIRNHEMTYSDHNAWLTNLFGETTPIDSTQREVSHSSNNNSRIQNSDGSSEKEMGASSNFHDSPQNKFQNNLPKLSTFTMIPSKSGHDVCSNTDMPSSPLCLNETGESRFSHSEVFAVSDSDCINTKEDRERSLVYFNQSKRFSLSPGNEATRNDTTMSWSAQLKREHERPGELSSPSTDLYSHEDVKASDDGNIYPTASIEDVFSQHIK